jgi:tRNA/rRNA methyltransferase
LPCTTPHSAPADAALVARMLSHLQSALGALGFLDPLAPKKLMPRLNQLFNRAKVTQEEIHILRGIAKAVLQQSAQLQTKAQAEVQAKAQAIADAASALPAQKLD